MRQLYTLVFYFLMPFVLLRLYWRGFKAPDYRVRWRERLGIYEVPPKSGVIWIHCVSVGEAEAAFPLIRMLQAEQAKQRFLITTTTPTGSARVSAVLADGVEHVYLPYDVPTVLRRFFSHFRPKMAIFMEKEIWPNLFAMCMQRNVPLFIINARLSERSARRYLKIPGLVKPALQCTTQVAVQTEEDKKRFIQIGAIPERVVVLGNIKFDLTISEQTIDEGRALKERQFSGRFVWMLASTHEGEESLLLQVFIKLKKQMPELLLMIAPRHPERFSIVRKLCQEAGLSVAMRSLCDAVTAQTDVYVADSMGELKMLYAAADASFVGGSLVPVGGHNVLEPALVGVPVLFGPHMFNFAEISERILADKAALQCLNLDAIADAVTKIHDDAAYRSMLIAKGKAFVLRNQGATRRIADLVTHWLVRVS